MCRPTVWRGATVWSLVQTQVLVTSAGGAFAHESLSVVSRLVCLSALRCDRVRARVWA